MMYTKYYHFTIWLKITIVFNDVEDIFLRTANEFYNRGYNISQETTNIRNIKIIENFVSILFNYITFQLVPKIHNINSFRLTDFINAVNNLNDSSYQSGIKFRTPLFQYIKYAPIVEINEKDCKIKLILYSCPDNIQEFYRRGIL